MPWTAPRDSSLRAQGRLQVREEVLPVASARPEQAGGLGNHLRPSARTEERVMSSPKYKCISGNDRLAFPKTQVGSTGSRKARGKQHLRHGANRTSREGKPDEKREVTLGAEPSAQASWGSGKHRHPEKREGGVQPRKSSLAVWRAEAQPVLCELWIQDGPAAGHPRPASRQSSVLVTSGQGWEDSGGANRVRTAV